MRWSPQQDAALRAVDAWVRDPSRKQVFRLFGFAGTGKTTLAKYLAQHVSGLVLFAAFTGKAASVLRLLGCPEASTIHSLIYHPRQRPDDKLHELKALLIEEERRSQLNEVVIERLKKEIKLEQENLKRPDFLLNTDSPLLDASLLVVDEMSMVDAEIGADLESFGVPILVLGDPAQLPPVRGGGYFTECEPDVMLTEVHRQARDNPIIEMATRVREGRGLPPGDYGNSQVINRATPELALEADQILVGMNRTREATNWRMRQLRGTHGHPWPTKGEKMVCLRNNRKLSLLNGTLHFMVDDAREADPYINLRIVPEGGGAELLVPAHPQFLERHGDPTEIGYWDRLSAEEFTYGDALTVHKGQGSQWGRTLVIDDWPRRETHQRWLYTGLTRAMEQTTVVRS